MPTPSSPTPGRHPPPLLSLLAALALVACGEGPAVKQPTGGGGGASGGGGGSSSSGGGPTFLVSGKPLGLQRDDRGVLHALVLADGALLYGRCASACTLASSWHLLRFTLTPAPRLASLAVAASGVVNVVWQTGGLVNVLRCAASDCVSTPAAWSNDYVSGADDGSDFTDLMGPRAATTDYEGILHVALHRQPPGSGLGTSVVGACGPECPAGWTFSNAFTTRTSTVAAMARGNGFLALAYQSEDGTLQYAECHQSCGRGSSWTSLVSYPSGTAGGVDLALYQGTSPRMAFRDETDRLVVVGCDYACGDTRNWAGRVWTAAPYPRPRDFALSLALQGQGVLVTSVEASGVALRSCASGCLASGTSWHLREGLDTDALSADHSAAQPTGCASGQAPWAETHVDGWVASVLDGSHLYVLDASRDLSGCGSDAASVKLGNYRARYFRVTP